MRKLVHAALWIGAGVLLYGLVACATLRGAGEGLKEDAKWLPDPYGAIADIAGTALVLFAGHKTAKHIRTKRRAKKALATHGKAPAGT